MKTYEGTKEEMEWLLCRLICLIIFAAEFISVEAVPRSTDTHFSIARRNLISSEVASEGIYTLHNQCKGVGDVTLLDLAS